jgi:hypothetical protein
LSRAGLRQGRHACAELGSAMYAMHFFMGIKCRREIPFSLCEIGMTD